jgi:hypothetical protein
MSPTALAEESEPKVTINKDGFVEGHIDLPVSKSEVHLWLADAVQASRLSNDVYDANSRKDGACDIIFRKVRGMWTPITYQARRCPTDTGWIEDLVESNTFSIYQMEWTLQGLEEGTRVGYKIKTEVNYPVPVSWVQTETKRSVKKMLKNLFSKFMRKKKKK